MAFPFLAATLGVAWGAMVGAALVGPRGLHASARRRIRAHGVERAGRSTDVPVPSTTLLAVVRRLRRARLVAPIVARRTRAGAARVVERELPMVVDLVNVAIGAGCTPYLALDVAARFGPPLVGGHVREVLDRCELGERLADALDDLGRRNPECAPLTDALTTGERLGTPMASVLTRLAAEQRASARRRAEAHARRVPVRLLFPLVFVVLPSFVLLTVVPGVAAGLRGL